MIPQATGWQHLRALSLDAIPVGARIFHTRAVPLHQWRTSGSYTVNSCTKKSVVLNSSALEIGGALLSDIEYLLDHIAEHRAILYEAISSERWSSPGWTVVTTYYWAFFSALALTRLAGRSVWFLDRDALANMRSLASSTEQPFAGALYFELGAYSSATNRNLVLRPSQKQFHDAVWLVVRDLIQSVLANCNKLASPLEYRMWMAMLNPITHLGYTWPSDIRNTVNYRIGSGYKEVTKRSDIDLVRFMAQGVPADFERLIDSHEGLGLAMSTYRRADEDPKLTCRLLGTYTIILSNVVEILHREILDRQKGDSRWTNMRSEFIELRCHSEERPNWPISS